MRIVISHKSLVSQLGTLPTGHLLEMDLTHPSHHVEVGLNQIFPALARMDIFLLNVEGLTNSQQLLRAKNAAIVRDEALWCSKLFDCRIQDNQDTGQILALKNITGENGS
ncbi:MAG TPA: hypothetical protein VIY29_22450 [Ktedonobacteraceae bacterium]